MVTVHGEGAVEWKIPGSVDYKSRRHPDSINRCPAGIPVVSSRGRSWRVLSEDSIEETQRGELGSKPTRPHIIIVVDANDNVVPSF